MSNNADRRGQLIADRYRLGILLGQGGFGSVYMAVDTKMENRRVAVKMLKAAAFQSSDMVERFRLEAKVMARLENPNIVHVSEYGETADGELYLVMEYLDAITLRVVMQMEQGPLPVKRVLHIAEQIAEALESVHREEVVHRDVKPENIMLLIGEQAHRDFVKVLDFGIAKDWSGEDSGLTTVGTTAGTPRYMSPEQICADPVTPASDLFVLAVVIYEMLAGRHPFGGETAREASASILSATPKSLVGTGKDGLITQEFEAVLLSGLDKDPDQRPKSVRAFVVALADAYAASITQEQSAPVVSRAPMTGSLSDADALLPTDAAIEAIQSASRPKWIWPLTAVALMALAFFIVRGQSSTCQSPLNNLRDTIRTQMATLAKAESARPTQAARYKQLSSRLRGAALILDETARKQCAAKATKLSPDWMTRHARIQISLDKLSVQLEAKTTEPKSSESTDPVGLTELIYRTADETLALEPLIWSPIVKRGASTLTVALNRSCVSSTNKPLAQCPKSLSEGVRVKLSANLSDSAHLYVLSYSQGGPFTVMRVTQDGAAKASQGRHALTLGGQPMAKMGAVVGVVASRASIDALDGVVGRTLAAQNGELHPDARKLLAGLSYSVIESGGPPQAWVRLD